MQQFVIFESRVVGGQSIAVCSFVLDNCIAFTLYEKKLEVRPFSFPFDDDHLPA